ncbi:CopG family transcriptional regulator [Pelagerythrobacter marinus]|uniref:CopG family transcriptional regulator n=1 Tax=Pelagerythrobacter marinus TaxID=538382 RepID=UPI002036E00C|nr:CopG family transcriptional regulator [Pelagerythrobacter marinus]USA38888.1 CopG family transcriptional regulator [Pelagerythrobacter marinus]WPZ07032.1 CopG family transcriptional regulator [Pelagerythrobacter marinus]
MSKGNRIKHTFRLPPDLSRQLADYAGRKRVSQASVVEAAIASFLSPDGSERMEAAFSRRLDRITRQLQKLDYHIEVGNEAFALYLRSWLAATPPPASEASAAARAGVEKRFENFVEALARRIERETHLADDLMRASEPGQEPG